jgi:hypothetical protein
LKAVLHERVRVRRPIINAAFVDIDAVTGVAPVMGRG